MKIRLLVFEPWADKGRVVPGFLSLRWAGKLNEHSILDVEVTRGSAAEEALEGECEVALQVDAGAGWFEPVGCRFRSRQYSSDRTKVGATSRYSFIGLGSLLSDILVWDQTSDSEEGLLEFSNVTPGYVLDSLLGDARQRHPGGFEWAPGLTWRFGGQSDSADRVWPENVSNAFVPTTPVFHALSWLASKGAVDWRMKGRELQVFVADTAMSREVPVRLHDAFATAAPVAVSHENVANVVMLRGKDGANWVQTSKEQRSKFGRIEVGLSHGQVSRDQTANLHLAARLKRGEDSAVQFRREWALTGEEAFSPWADYNLGDWALVAGERMRIVEAGVQVHSDGRVTGWETLGSRLTTLVERLAKRTRDLSDGMAGGEFAPVKGKFGPDYERGVPAAPDRVRVSSRARENADGSHTAVLSVVWEPVQVTVDRKPVSIAEYEVQVRDGSGPVRVQRFQGASGVLDFPAGLGARVQVRALSKQNVWSAWSVEQVHVAESDTEAPPKPARPVLSDDLGVLKVSHNGLDSSGAAMPADVDYWQVAVSTSNTSNPDPDGVVADAGGLVWHRAGLDAGTRYYVRVRAVDRSGNVGAWSDSVSGSVSLVFDPEPLRREIASGTIIGDDAIKTRHLAALSVGADQLKVNAVTAGKIKAGALDTFVLTGATVQTDKRSNHGVKLNASGLYAYDSSGNETVKITADGGRIKGYTIEGGYVRGSVIESSSGLNSVTISNGEINLYSGGSKSMSLDSDELSFYRGGTLIGHFAAGTHTSAPGSKGVVMRLENDADYIAWSYRENPYGTYTAYLTFDPKGKINRGQAGIHLDWSLHMGADIYMHGRSFVTDAGIIKLDGEGGWPGRSGRYPALTTGSASIGFIGSDIWVYTGRVAYNLTEKLAAIQ